MYYMYIMYIYDINILCACDAFFWYQKLSEKHYIY